VKPNQKTHNAPDAKEAKVRLRQYALDAVPNASVLDAFAGRGEMHRAVWHKATRYVGCDLVWERADPGMRFAADNKRVLRAIDLAPFNIFDLDAFGDPSEQMLIIAARKRWGAGERGALILTDGSSLKTRFGSLSRGQAEFAGMQMGRKPCSAATSVAAGSMALRSWMHKSRVKLLRMWQAEGRGSGRGGARMVYTAVVFDGLAT